MQFEECHWIEVYVEKNLITLKRLKTDAMGTKV